jgi:stearoyl-CoA desaturase (Delta-9 desaturase)
MFVGILAFGEGWHNYHHVFPWDYKTAELGGYEKNLTTGFLDLFAKIGWAYDLKTVSDTMIQKRLLRTGDGSHHTLKHTDIHVTSELFRKVVNDEHNDEDLVWGWDDADMSHEDKADAKVLGVCSEK